MNPQKHILVALAIVLLTATQGWAQTALYNKEYPQYVYFNSFDNPADTVGWSFGLWRNNDGNSKYSEGTGYLSPWNNVDTIISPIIDISSAQNPELLLFGIEACFVSYDGITFETTPLQGKLEHYFSTDGWNTILSRCYSFPLTPDVKRFKIPNHSALGAFAIREKQTRWTTNKQVVYDFSILTEIPAQFSGTSLQISNDSLLFKKLEIDLNGNSADIAAMNTPVLQLSYSQININPITLTITTGDAMLTRTIKPTSANSLQSLTMLLPDNTSKIVMETSAETTRLLKMEIKDLTFVVSSRATITDLSCWYSEIEEDPNMQFAVSSQKFRLSGNGQSYGYGIFNFSPIRPLAISNDGIMDFYSPRGRLAIYKENGETANVNIDGTHNTRVIVPVDYNLDGRMDFLLGEDAWVQGADGTFVKRKLNVMSPETYAGEFSYYMVKSNLLEMPNPKSETRPTPLQYARLREGQEMYTIDIDGNGSPDLLNAITGELWKSINGDNFVREQLGGNILFRDLNNDGLIDYITYDQASTNTREVTAYIQQTDGSWKAQPLMGNRKMDDQMWVYDYEGDGDVDIILPFSSDYANQAAGAYLAVMLNDGNGNFTRKATGIATTTAVLKFTACADLNNDGYYDILALRDASHSSGYDQRKIVWLKGNAQGLFDLQETPLFASGDAGSQNVGYKGAAIADLNNDGVYELITTESVYMAGDYGGRVVSINIPGLTPHVVPKAPSKPELAYDAALGYLKISWKPTAGEGYSTADLSYELRIGTAPGKGDIFYANAYADGRRKNLMDGNMGYTLDRLINASGWNAGDYYVSIQAITPARRGSAFSEEAVFSKTQLPASFILSSEKTTSDTLSVILPAGIDPNIEYIWDFADATVVENKGATIRLKFTEPGEKKITLRTKNDAGEISALCEQRISLYANKFTPAFIHSAENDYTELTYTTVADLDNSGEPEILTDNGIYQFKDKFKRIDEFWNLGLDFYSSETTLMDYNNDGKVDVFNTRSNLNSGNTSVYINSSTPGNVALESDYPYPVNLAHKFRPEWDWNNDGKADAIMQGSDPAIGTVDIVNLNNGDYKNFTKVGQLTTSRMSDQPIPFFPIDLNHDGFLDRLGYVDYRSGGMGSPYRHMREVIMQLNDGKGAFSEKIIPITTLPSLGYNDRLNSNFIFADVNGDGFSDLIASDINDIYVLLNRQNENFDETYKFTLPTEAVYYSTGLGQGWSIAAFPAAYDFDNNGYTDIQVNYSLGYGKGSNRYIMHFYENMEVSFYEIDNASDYSYASIEQQSPYDDFSLTLFADVDGDGIQDVLGARTMDNEIYYRGYKNASTVANTPPAPPANIRWTQTDSTLLIEWDKAIDAESPAALLRYNVSVKKQSATGDNAFVISPLNNLSNNAAPISLKDYPYNPLYRTANRMEIPLTAFTPGTNYDIQIQTLDGWNAVSVFSAPTVARIENNPQIKVPASICAQTTAIIEYKGAGIPSERQWNWDGGELVSTDGNFYEVVWNEAGAKTISVTVGGTMVEAMLMVLSPIDATFSIPEVVSAQSTISVLLPGTQHDYRLTWSYGISEFNTTYTGGNAAFAPVWRVNAAKGTGSLSFPKEGYYRLRFTAVAPCGEELSEWYEVQTINIPKPEITLVTALNGKNRISWNVPADLPAVVTGVKVYKEGSRYNDFQTIASLPLNEISFTDSNSNVNIMASRYRLTWMTKDGSESAFSEVHKGIHLMLNRGVGNAWNLFWGQYEGAIIESFSILRGTSPDNLELLQEISGSNASYSDLTPPADDLYYAVQYNTVYTPDPSGSPIREKTRRANLFAKSEPSAGCSNVVSTGAGFNATLATEIRIDAADTLSPSEPNTLLTASITPQTVTYKTANWTIVSGENLATLNNNGILTLTGTGNGDVVVKATTIDGSNIFAQKTIRVRNVISSIEVISDKDVLTENDHTATLSADILPADMATASVVWSITSQSEGFEASLSDNQLQVYNITADGIITVRATTTNGSGMYAEKTLDVSYSSEPLVNAQTPTINTQPQNVNVNVNGSAGLSVSASVTDGGTLSYQWFSNTINSTNDGENLGASNGAQTTAYSPSTASEGTMYYYVVITNTNTSVNGTQTATATSDVAIVTVTEGSVVNAQTPTINAQPDNVNVNVNGSAGLSVSASVTDGGTLSYQWFSNTVNSTDDGVNLGASNGAQTATYSPSTASEGTMYYYVEITNTNTAVNGTQTASVTSNIAKVIVTNGGVVNAQTPIINAQPNSVNVEIGDPANVNVAAYVTDGGTLSYQWFSNTVNSTNDGVNLGSSNGAQTATYNASTATAGTTYYYVEITNTNTSVNGTQTATAKSNVATVVVSKGTAILDDEANPTLTIYPNPITNGELKIENGKLPVGDVSIYDLKGKLVYQQLSISDWQLTINISALPNGTYVVKIGEKSAKIVKQ